MLLLDCAGSALRGRSFFAVRLVVGFIRPRVALADWLPKLRRWGRSFFAVRLVCWFRTFAVLLKPSRAVGFIRPRVALEDWLPKLWRCMRIFVSKTVFESEIASRCCQSDFARPLIFMPGMVASLELLIELWLSYITAGLVSKVIRNNAFYWQTYLRPSDEFENSNFFAVSDHVCSNMLLVCAISVHWLICLFSSVKFNSLSLLSEGWSY